MNKLFFDFAKSRADGAFCHLRRSRKVRELWMGTCRKNRT